jgi:hypothetical protein
MAVASVREGAEVDPAEAYKSGTDERKSII